MKYVLATKNKGKLEEFKKLFSEMGLEIVSEEEFFNGEIIENGKTFEENSFIKAKTIGDISGLPTIADDSGLCIDDLDGEPGIFSARYFPECLNYTEKCEKMIKLVDSKKGNRKAHFISVITIYDPKNSEVKYFKGKCDGEILKELKGTNGHGYDPIFYSYELKKGFAEVSLEEKNRVSHRAKAFQLLKEYLLEK